MAALQESVQKAKVSRGETSETEGTEPSKPKKKASSRRQRSA
ncbi:hypothetical protein [Streptomyces sp. NPDC054834]